MRYVSITPEYAIPYLFRMYLLHTLKGGLEMAYNKVHVEQDS